MTSGNTLGSDFYVFWLAGRAVLFDHSSPYSPELARQAQLAVLHRPALPGEDQLAFAYPPYILLAALPTFWMPYDWAQAFWMALLLLALVSVLFAVFRAPRRGLVFSLLLFYPVFFGLILGNFVILVGAILLLVLGLVVLQEDHNPALQVLSGLLLAWACAKPQVVWLFAAFILVYAIKRQLWGLVTSLFANLGVFFLLSFVIYPPWYLEWVPALQNYAAYNQAQALLFQYLSAVLPAGAASTLGALLAAAILALTAVFFVRWWQGKITALQLIAWCGFGIFLLHPSVHSYEQIVFLVPLALWTFQQNPTRPRWMAVFWLAWLVLSWVSYALAQVYAHLAVDALPFLGYLLWLGWVMKKPAATAYIN